MAQQFRPLSALPEDLGFSSSGSNALFWPLQAPQRHGGKPPIHKIEINSSEGKKKIKGSLSKKLKIPEKKEEEENIWSTCYEGSWPSYGKRKSWGTSCACVVLYVCYPSCWEGEAGGSGVKAGLACIRGSILQKSKSHEKAKISGTTSMNKRQMLLRSHHTAVVTECSVKYTHFSDFFVKLIRWQNAWSISGHVFRGVCDGIPRED